MASRHLWLKQSCFITLRLPIFVVALRHFYAASSDPDDELGEMHPPDTQLTPIVLLSAAGRWRKLCVYRSDRSLPDGTSIRDYTHIIVLAVASVSEFCVLEQSFFKAFDLGTGTGHSMLEMNRCA